MDRITERGTITQVLKRHKFEVALEDMPNWKVQTTISGKMMIKRITLIVGDAVNVELSPYDLTRGRITWRYQ